MSTVAFLVAQGTAVSRAEIARQTGLARSTVSQRVEQLLDLGLLIDSGTSASTVGRPPAILSVNPDAGVLLSANVGASHVRLGVSDLGMNLVAEHAAALNINEGPDRVLDRVWSGFRELLARSGHALPDVLGVGIGLPGPVESATGTVVKPPIMAGWDGYRVPGYFAGLVDAPVVVDNDVNNMALGEYWVRKDVQYLLYVKIGTGIGCGIVSEGYLHRGADGAAGDIGHIQLSGRTRCHCGNIGCVEAVASGAALVRALRRQGFDVGTSQDVVDLAAEGNVAARHAVREAGQRIGQVLTTLVSFYNPAAIVLGGALAQVSEELLASIRGAVYRRALPLATRNLRMETSRLGPRAGVVGATVLTLQHVLAPDGLASLLASGAAARR